MEYQAIVSYTTKAAAICEIDHVPFYGTLEVKYHYADDAFLDVNDLDAYLLTLTGRELVAESYAMLVFKYLSEQKGLPGAAVTLEVESLQHGAIKVQVGRNERR